MDWCTATDRVALPASPDTILAFLADLPAGPATVLRRVRAVDATHRSAGWSAPSAAPAFDELLRPARPPRFDPAVVARTLEGIPVGGWPAGIVGRRDAALVALVCSAGLTRRHIQTLRGTSGPDGYQVEPAIPALMITERPGACPACAVTRWLRVHAVTSAAGWRAVRVGLADLGETPAGTETAHDCARPVIGPAMAGSHDAPLVSPIDRHGVPEAVWPLSTRSITTIVATRLASPTAWHLHGDTWDRSDRSTSGPGRVWGDADRARVLAERKAATDRLAGMESVLDEADAYAETILQSLDVALRGAPAGSNDDLG